MFCQMVCVNVCVCHTQSSVWSCTHKGGRCVKCSFGEYERVSVCGRMGLWDVFSATPDVKDPHNWMTLRAVITQIHFKYFVLFQIVDHFLLFRSWWMNNWVHDASHLDESVCVPFESIFYSFCPVSAEAVTASVPQFHHAWCPCWHMYEQGAGCCPLSRLAGWLIDRLTDWLPNGVWNAWQRTVILTVWLSSKKRWVLKSC